MKVRSRLGLVARVGAAAAAVVAIAATLVSAPAAPSTAANLAMFRAGNIISDSVFFAGTVWGQTNVQQFLDAKGSGCTVGADGTACLKNYRTTTNTRTPDNRCPGGYTGATDELASAIIAKVGASCGINPQVILVILQKEQGLVTTTGAAAVASRYQKAMGYGCPDTSVCDSKYYGFFNQVYQAAWQFKNYALNPTAFGYRAGLTNTILYNPNKDCGSSQVVIENQATAGLYNYTPYQPNAAALAAGYGTGDACSAYGNRNFWNYFNDWFGSSTDLMPAARSLVRALYVDLLGREGEPAGVEGWAGLVVSGASAGQMVTALTGSTEYAQLRVTAAYKQVLGRDPDASGLAGWVTAIQQGRVGPDDVARLFYESPEFYLLAGNEDHAFVTRLYERMLGREPSAAEVAYWVARVPSLGRGGVAYTVWQSMEAAQQRSAAYYQTFLGRAPEWNGMVYWAQVMLAQGESAVRVGIAGSTEYWQRAITRYP
ncbi:DUF4214 domain-containing protein [Cellulomonas sp. NTE-D12]|uniref:DUF4214 domain-containing protein n=1 Tax=Cellulomonas sp. NTE-D12 TaxID=2962632 RepID=UPI003081DA45|nr:hypothetical protein CELD12_23500 [Cellulomonas sp. NTE-D12]